LYYLPLKVKTIQFFETSLIRRQRHGDVASQKTRVLGHTAVIACKITAHCTDRTECGCAVSCVPLRSGWTSVRTVVTTRAATLQTLQHFNNAVSLSYVQPRSCFVEHNTRHFVFLDSATKPSGGNLLSPSPAYKLDDSVTTFMTRFGTQRQDCTMLESRSLTVARAPLNPVSTNITVVSVRRCKAQHCHSD